MDNKNPKLFTHVSHSIGFIPPAIAHYSEPNSDEPCSKCHCGIYDSYLNEYWCGRTPPPEGLPPRRLVGEWGHCDFWIPKEPTS